MSDEELVSEYLKGTETALNILIKRHLDAVFAFLMGYTHDKISAEDLAQESFIKAWKNLKKFDSSYKFKTWLYTIAKRTALDYLKKKRTVPFSDLWSEELGEFDAPGKDNVQAQSSLTLEWALKILPEKYSRILKLYYVEGFNFRQISERLEQSINTTKTQHRRAILELRKVLD